MNTTFARSRSAGVWGALLLCCALAAPLQARNFFLKDDEVNPRVLLPIPPTPNSPEGKAELQAVRYASQNAAPDEVKIALAEDAHPSVFMFRPAIGPEFTSNNFPAVIRLINEVGVDIHAELDAKQYFKRLRPETVDPKLRRKGLKPDDTYSYPSGHSTYATVESLILADLFPEKSDAIMEEGRRIGWHRVILGRHFPSDIDAGRILGQAIVRQLKMHADYREEFARARNETRQYENYLQAH